MTNLKELPKSDSGEYFCTSNLNLYDGPGSENLATQAAKGRNLRILGEKQQENSIKIQLAEDSYLGWLKCSDLVYLQPAAQAYQAIAVSRSEIEASIPKIIAFTKAAMQQPNYYLWGGTVAPNYDCSGLIQAAFVDSGIWLPRDSYQQEAFTQTISQEQLLPGDLIFFGQEKVNHVALSLGDNYYIHSSGQEIGRNGIGIDRLSLEENSISRRYYQQLWSCGRVMFNYQPD